MPLPVERQVEKDVNCTKPSSRKRAAKPSQEGRFNDYRKREVYSSRLEYTQAGGNASYRTCILRTLTVKK